MRPGHHRADRRVPDTVRVKRIVAVGQFKDERYRITHAYYAAAGPEGSRKEVKVLESESAGRQASDQGDGPAHLRGRAEETELREAESGSSSSEQRT